MKLGSGAELKLNPAPFVDAHALLKAFLAEAKGIDVKGDGEMANMMKNVFCAAFTSPSLEAALKKCMEKCTYNAQKIVDDTWEPLQARGDYLEVCYLVAEENLKPFTKSLYAQFTGLLKRIESIQA